MNRLELKDRTFLAVAGQIAMLGTCDRKHVGAVLVKRGRCISWGFNGAPPGLPHCEENNHGWLGIPCGYRDDDGVWHEGPTEADGCRNATHAEANALAAAARQGISTARATLYVTVSPCDTCARLLIASGIERVVYLEEYRDESGVRLLREAGLVCQSLYSELRGGSPE